ncbi:MAG: flagellar basal-body MS-ring/collar protein FliF [Acidobacteria bacterium]|nr:flagellar basal-body MS-ring/collar protein FliF [Acidobacteriota bacterium]
MDFENTFKRLAALGGSLSTTQLVSLVAAFVGVVALVVGSANWLSQESYVLLFTDLDAVSATDVVGRLKSMKEPYKIADGGRTVRVPERRIDELRLQFASTGMPSAGRIGFEIFDQVSFGATEFLEQVNYRRALEGEIARTIATLTEVSSARVHIATTKNSLFETRQQPAKASVVLKLRGNKTLGAGTVQGICALVAAAVEGLRPEAVVILDSFGRPLTKSSDEGDLSNSGPSMDRQLSLEKDLTTKVVSLLEPVVGSGRVRVNVAVRLNAQSEEQTEERWDPNTTVVRSKVTSSDQATANAQATGIAGARANLPDPAAKPADPARPPDVRLAGRSSETANYEISRTTRHTTKPNGEIARLSVAVILDDLAVTTTGSDGTVKRTNKPRTKNELLRIQNLVTAAVGIDASRGDLLTVDNVSFTERPDAEDVPVPVGTLEKYSPQINDIGRLGVVLVLGAMAFFMVIRPIVKKALAGPMTPMVPAPALSGQSAASLRTIEDLEGAIEAELDAATAQNAHGLKIPVLSKRIGAMTQKEPEHAARLVRAWLREDRR